VFIVTCPAGKRNRTWDMFSNDIKIKHQKYTINLVDVEMLSRRKTQKMSKVRKYGSYIQPFVVHVRLMLRDHLENVRLRVERHTCCSAQDPTIAVCLLSICLPKQKYDPCVMRCPCTFGTTSGMSTPD
jgi:hypothetical protein